MTQPGGPLRRNFDAIDRLVRRAREGRASRQEVGEELVEHGLQLLLLAEYCTSWGLALRDGYDDPRVPPPADPQP